MSFFWLILVCSCVLLVWIFELLASRRERSARAILLLTEDSYEKSIRYIPRMLLYTALGALLVAFGLYAFHVKWSVPKNSVAIVFDAESGTEYKASFAQQKAVLQELVQGLPEISLSLYQVRDGKLSCFVPSTIDRVYFSLIADSLQPSQGKSLPLETIQNQIFTKETGTVPWIIVVSSQWAPRDMGNFDGVSLVVPHLPEVMIRSIEDGREERDPSFDGLMTRINSRILRSEEVFMFDWFERTLVIFALTIALVALIHWRRRLPPLFLLGALCAHTCLGAEHQALSENAAVRQYIDLADEKEYAAASQNLQEILPSIVDPLARERIFYDIALIFYLQGNERDSLSWLKSGQVGNKSAQLAEKAKVLRVLALSRLVRGNDTSADWREDLQKLLENSVDLPRSVFAEASFSLLLPPNFSQDTMKTFIFYVQSLSSQYPVALYEKNTFRSLVLATQKGVEKELNTFFPQGVNAFQTLSGIAQEEPFLLDRYLLWYTVSQLQREEDAIQYLLDEALESVTEKMYFPMLGPLLDEKMEDIVLLLGRRISLPHEDSLEKLSAAWYVKARLWAFFRGNDKLKSEKVVIFLGSELEQKLPPLVQKMLVKECIRRQGYPKTWYREEAPLTTLFWNAFVSWKAKESLSALDWLISKVSQDPSLWMAFMERLFVEERFFGLPLKNNLKAYDLLPLGRLVSIERSPLSTQEEATNCVARLMVLYKGCLGKKPSGVFFDTLGIITEEQAKIGDMFLLLPVFKDDYTKRVNFENLIEEWKKRSYRVEQLVKTYDRERGETIVRKELKKCYEVLVQIHELLDEKEPTSEEAVLYAPVSSQEKHLTIREEKAVQLYQEMDRMDRDLYGE